MGRVPQVQRANALGFSATLILALLLALAGCSTHTVKTANYVAVERENAALPEDQLLDVGVQVFDTGLEIVPDDEDLLVFPEVRKAESRFMPHRVMDALQTSAAWGAVRVTPESHDAVDVLVQGQIIQSDGEMLLLKVDVTDATGRLWFSRVYEGLASKYAYERRPGRDPQADPFQGVYNRIANDMLAYRSELSASELKEIRTVAELRFAQDFSPEAFGDHLRLSPKGRYEVVRLPAENDPMLARIRGIRERDYLFVDTMQEYYGNFVLEMERPYQEWRKQTYAEVVSMRDLRRSARNRTIAGVASIIGGIAAAGNSAGAARAAGHVGIIGGGYMVKSGFDKRSQAKIHVEALQELGDSLEAEMQPRVIALEDRSFTLSGTVENQYEQWRELLKEIYRLDTAGTARLENNRPQNR